MFRKWNIRALCERLTASYAFRVYRQDSPVRSGPSPGPLKCTIWLNVEWNTCYSCHQEIFNNIHYDFLLLLFDNHGILSTTFAASKLLCCLLILLAIQQQPLLREPPAAAVAGAARCCCCGSRPSYYSVILSLLVYEKVILSKTSYKNAIFKTKWFFFSKIGFVLCLLSYYKH